MIKIKILTGSTRPGRFNSQPAKWLLSQTQSNNEVTFELVDIQDLNLPFLDEEQPPMLKKYSKEHTFKWSKIVEEADGFVFVTPEYNHSISPALKNALDYLWQEWHYKPVTFVSYGSMAGGARAVEHLRQISAELKMYDLREQILLPNYWENLDENGQYKFSEKHEKSAKDMLETLVFWAKKMQQARAELS